MKKVTHIISELDVGGTEKQLALIVPTLQENFSNEVICLMGKGKIGTLLEQQGVTVRYIESRGVTDIPAFFRLYKTLKTNKPDIVITFLIYADILGRFAAKLAGIKTVICSHRSALFGPSWWHAIDRFTRFLVTRYTTQTTATKNLISAKLRIPLKHIIVIPNAVSLPAPIKNRTDTKKELNIPEQSTVITCVANLKESKGLELLVEAFEKLHLTFPDTHLLLIGEGPLRKLLEEQIKAYTSKSFIHMPGSKNNISEILHASDIFVLPTLIEGMSNALLEGMSAELPCVTSDIPVNKEVITPGESGLLFKTNDIDDLYRALTELLADRSLQKQLGKNAREYVQRYHSVSVVTDTWKNLLTTKLPV